MKWNKIRLWIAWALFCIGAACLIMRALNWTSSTCRLSRGILSVSFYSLLILSTAHYIAWRYLGTDLFLEQKYSYKRIMFLASLWMHVPLSLGAIIIVVDNFSCCSIIDNLYISIIDWATICALFILEFSSIAWLVLFIVKNCTKRSLSTREKIYHDFVTMKASLEKHQFETPLYLHYYKPVKREGLGLDDIELGYLNLVCIESHENELPNPDDPSYLPQCCVCLSSLMFGQLVLRLPSCLHTLHANCAEGWLSREPRCPLCKNDVRRGLFYKIRHLHSQHHDSPILSTRSVLVTSTHSLSP